MAHESMVIGLLSVDHVQQLCDACLAGKQRRAPFPQKAKYRAKDTLELVHADLCGPIWQANPSGKRYFMLLVDDASRYMWAVMLSMKDSAEDTIKKFKIAAELKSRHPLRTFHTDHGREFTSNSLGAFFTEHGVQRHLTTPYSPQQNGVVERRNQTWSAWCAAC
jgi:transposase InsO family protein